ncbi:Protein chromatin remodeling 5 [Vitis vinifera]|uniref:Protein chromatin remodeling 5 n=1 Tax=Vitis vinifera TaxID=29760 RepID=A0A438KGH6_VITVI|nr:Protein chromatin remodeling 5 [Vitis vinifera]
MQHVEDILEVEGPLIIYCYYFLKEEIEEEDCDSIEKVLWHQPKGMADEALKNNKSTEPILLSHLFDFEPNWNEMEFLIKWKGQSHLHCQWKSFSDLQNVSLLNTLWLSGFKKVLNYTKKVMEEVKYRNMFSREEVMSTLRYFCICKFRYETFLHNV